MKIILIIVALVVALLVTFAVSGVLKDKEVEQPTVLSTAPVPQPATVPETDIYVARRDIQIGANLTEEDYDIKPWPQHLLPPAHIPAGGEGIPPIVGQIAAAPIIEGEPLSASKLKNPNDPSFLAGQLPEGMRAVSVGVNLVDSVTGFVSPGDMVDVIFTFELATETLDTGDLAATGGREEERVGISEVLLPAVKVLAVDRRVVAGNTPDGEQPPVPASVTLAVNQRDAQKLRLGEKMGRLSLILRSLADNDNNDVPRPSAEQDLTRLLPPAYFPALFDSDAAYDYSVIDLYGSAETVKEGEKEQVKKESPFMNVKIYRGVELQQVEVARP
ncbi:MAG: Flp pilus assembly protein CpaB [Alphaproteobacteria bacterium CG11_big_fil_rev_8_21_14_0_20_44_7]|nr:MAG: Flp pilus assembly protein CpaB [Alphaproteobacteria bacterium CG11_big_fil_rev_8_21_14_0_20_44_7]